jgi:hypothetical protein
MTIYHLAHGVAYGVLQDVFGLSPARISEVLPVILEGIIKGMFMVALRRVYKTGINSLGGHYAFSEPDTDTEPEQWASGTTLEDQRFQFLNTAYKKCIGAADGTFVPVSFREDGRHLNTASWVNRKGVLTTNVLAVIRHDKTFSKVFVGASGCCNDQFIINKIDLTGSFPG